MDEDNPYVIDKHLEPFAYSGLQLMGLLEESGTGKNKLEIGLALFPKDPETGEITADIPAEKVVRAYYKADSEFVSTVTKDKVKGFFEVGSWKPKVKLADTVSLSHLAKTLPLVQKPVKKSKAVDPAK